jgi:hypothetical protein
MHFFECGVNDDNMLTTTCVAVEKTPFPPEQPENVPEDRESRP